MPACKLVNVHGGVVALAMVQAWYGAIQLRWRRVQGRNMLLPVVYRDGVTGFTNLEWSMWQVHIQRGRRVHRRLVLM